MTDRKALGRGLAALIPQRFDAQAGIAGAQGLPGAEKAQEVIYISTADIRPNRFQPRKDFNDEKLKDLADSVRQSGVLQPVLVRPLGENGFELLAGERRWRAAKLAGLEKVPAIINDAHDAGALEISLIENLQRDDLNPLEEARAYKQLMDDFAFTVDRVALAVGRAPSSVSNILRLLSLPDKVREAISSGLISAGHAKAILALKDARLQEKFCQRIIATGMSVRQAEIAASLTKGQCGAAEVIEKNIETAVVEEQLSKALGTRASIIAGRRGGRVVIEYFSTADLDRIVGIITRAA